MTPVLLTVSEAMQAWEHVAPRLARLRARVESDDVRRMVETGERQMWVVTDGRAMKAVFFTEIKDYPRGRWCEIGGLVGEEMSGWVAQIAAVEAWAKQLGCAKVAVTGRRGWGRALAAHGYREADVVLEKELAA